MEHPAEGQGRFRAVSLPWLWWQRGTAVPSAGRSRVQPLAGCVCHCRATVHIQVNDVNEYAPVFKEKSYKATVMEGKRYDNILRVEAVDADCSPQFSQICSYEIVTPDVPFAIDKDGKGQAHKVQEAPCSAAPVPHLWHWELKCCRVTHLHTVSNLYELQRCYLDGFCSIDPEELN